MKHAAFALLGLAACASGSTAPSRAPAPPAAAEKPAKVESAFEHIAYVDAGGRPGEADVPRVALLDRGAAEPRISLLADDQQHQYLLDVRIAEQTNADGDDATVRDSFQVEATLAIIVEPVRADGLVAIGVLLEQPRVANATQSAGKLAGIEALDQLMIRFLVTSRGQVVDRLIGAPSAPGTLDTGILGALLEDLEPTLFVAVPADTLGTGARWRIHRRTDIGTVAAIEEVTYRLAEIDGVVARIEAETRRLPLIDEDGVVPSNAEAARIRAAIESMAHDDLEAAARDIKPEVRGSFTSIRALPAGMLGLVSEWKSTMTGEARAVTGDHEHAMKLQLTRQVVVYDPRYKR
jgi:hypothetical protein